MNFQITLILVLTFFGCSSYVEEDCFEWYFNQLREKLDTSKVDIVNVDIEKDYYDNYIKLLESALNKNISYVNPRNIALAIVDNSTKYEVNFLRFDIEENGKPKTYSGQFNTKSVISFEYIEDNNVGYLLLYNRVRFKEYHIIEECKGLLGTLISKNKCD